MSEIRMYSKKRLFVIGLIIGTGVTLAMLALFAKGALDFLENRSIDWRFLMRGEIEGSPRIVIVSIDEASFSELNRNWPWPRTYLARCIDRLHKEGAKAIGIDIIMSEPDPGDEDLARSSRSFGNVVLASKFEETIRRVTWKEKEVELREEALKGPTETISGSGDVGYLNLPQDGDGFVRRFAPVRPHQDQVYASFDLKIALRFQEIPLGDLTYAPFERLRIGNRSIPLNHDDSAFINFAGPAGKFKRVSFYQVLEGLHPPGFFNGNIVLIGPTFLDSKDFFSTPFTETKKGRKYPLFGVEIHANIINGILKGNFIRPLPPLLQRLVVLLGGILVTLLSLRLPPLKGAFSIFLLVIAYGIGCVRLFAGDILVPASAPVLTFAAVFFSLSVFRYFTEEREKRQIRGMFQKYVSPGVVDKLIEDPRQLRLGGEKRCLTVLFSDIRGFTSISEQMPPEDILKLLNQYLTAMTAVVLKNGGMLDKYVGDAVMAVFGAPLEAENHALLACRTAVEMMEELGVLQREWADAGKPVLDIGIGINTGEMVIGNVGSPSRMDYTVIGDHVNLASRLEGVNKEFGTHIIISGFTHEIVEGKVAARALGEIRVKGKGTPVPVYELLGIH